MSFTDADASGPQKKIWPVGKKNALFCLAVLFLFGFMDYGDRMILSSLLPYIKADWGLSDTQVGSVMSVINISIALISIPAGYLIDRWSRKKLITLFGTIWAASVGACAFAGNYLMLIACRAMCGFCEAGYQPAGMPLVMYQFPERHRSTGLAVMVSGAALGAPLGLMIGGQMGVRFGWQHSLGLVAIPGLILAVCALFFKDFPNRPAPKQTVRKSSFLSDMKTLLSTHTLAFVLIGAAFVMITNGATMSFQIIYLVQTAGWEPVQAATVLGTLGLGSLISAFGSGPVIDKLRQKRQDAPILVLFLMISISAVALTSAYGFLRPGSPAQIACMFISGIGFGCHGCSASTAIQELAAPSMRGKSASLLVMFQNLIGFALGPILAGMLSDLITLPKAMLVAAMLPFISCTLYAIGLRTYVSDRNKVNAPD